ncbi:MAG: GMC family oxidoreductase [Actinobacteria bacterium]|nr:GMC family oxidoreductase [Actinomycetota bacterium]
MSTIRAELLVIGSGAGGAVTAALAAEAGRDVLIVEEGPWATPGDVEPFSMAEMMSRYRNHGLTAALGNPGISYAEGRCVGGSTEINSGLYRRLPEELRSVWASAYRIDEFDAPTLDKAAEEVESFLDITHLPGDPPPASAAIARGADALGWRSTEFARAFSYESDGHATKQTMARTYVPRAIAAGARLLADTRIDRLVVRDGRCRAATGIRTADGTNEKIRIEADDVFVCAGAVHTPFLLQRSGFRGGIGSGLRFHPTIKVAARFTIPMDHGDVPMHRVMEFGPHLTIGGSASRRAHVALALADAALPYDDALADWDNVAVYYAAIKGGNGRVVSLPGIGSPIVFYSMGDADMSRLARGTIHLGSTLFAAGATELYPSIVGGPILKDPDRLVDWWDAISRSRANVMTVHLTSTVRMGENTDLACADSFGRLHGTENIRVNDASLLPDAPGVNPQAAIMMLATRNIRAFLN